MDAAYTLHPSYPTMAAPSQQWMLPTHYIHITSVVNSPMFTRLVVSLSDILCFLRQQGLDLNPKLDQYLLLCFLPQVLTDLNPKLKHSAFSPRSSQTRSTPFHLTGACASSATSSRSCALSILRTCLRRFSRRARGSQRLGESRRFCPLWGLYMHRSIPRFSCRRWCC